MSAYICNPEHIGLIAAWAVKHKAVRGFSPDDMAREMMSRNIHAIDYRYPGVEERDRPGPTGMTDKELISEACRWALCYAINIPENVAPLTIAKLVDGYEYQACEHPEWDTCTARDWVNKIRVEVLSMLPGYDRAPWSWSEELAEAED
jgi:hypothetical protein